MKNFKEIVYGNLFEAKGQKPDFRDLDGDGNKEEPMKKAAKDAKKKKGKMEEEVEIAEELLEETDPEDTEQANPSLEEAVKTILDEEGGAADLKKIEEKLRNKNMEVPMDLEEKLKDMKNVMKHIKGDYIEMSGLKDQNPNMMLPEE
mgnify:CR=1 FL=1|tara:strand:+ start:49 stop:489 length:441 start_codon:yes stop_codon:yes gene_type:complete